MRNSTALWTILAIVIIIGGLAYAFSGPVNKAETDESRNSPYNDKFEGENTQGRGRAVFSVTDAAADMENVSEINLEIRSVDVHSSTLGWINVSAASKSYDLLSLREKSQSELLADVELDAGAYDQIRLNINSVKVTTKDGKSAEAKLPGGELKINTKLAVNADATSSINLDFLADKSLHMTGNGSYVFAPVVKTETRSNTEINIDSSGVVSINGGSVDDSAIVGMDVDGSVKANFELKADQKINVESDNSIKIGL